jgi:hypothetical protein
VLEHDSEKWISVVGKRSCSAKRLEREDHLKRSPRARAPVCRSLAPIEANIFETSDLP